VKKKLFGHQPAVSSKIEFFVKHVLFENGFFSVTILYTTNVLHIHFMGIVNLEIRRNKVLKMTRKNRCGFFDINFCGPVRSRCIVKTSVIINDLSCEQRKFWF